MVGLELWDPEDVESYEFRPESSVFMVAGIAGQVNADFFCGDVDLDKALNPKP